MPDSTEDIAPNKALIPDDIRYWLSTISEANGQSMDVVTVGAAMLSFDKAGPKPALFAFPAQGSPPPTQHPFDDREEFVDVHIVGHVEGDDEATISLDLATLEEDVHRVLEIDRRRDGWAVDTWKHVGPLTDEGKELKGGLQGGGGTFVTGVRVRYYPRDDNEGASVAHGESYLTAGLTTTVTVGGTYLLANGTAADGDLKDFTTPTASGHRLKYTGQKTRKFLVTASGTLAGDTAGDVSLRIAKNGTTVAKTQTDVAVAADATDRRAYAIQGIIELATDDYVEVFLTEDNTGDVTLHRLTFVATQVPKF